MTEKKKWHIWSIRQSKIESIKHFIEVEVPEVEEVFFPTVNKEYKAGRKLRKKSVPLYSGYLFLRYTDCGSNVFYKVRSNPFVTNYLGVCGQGSIDEMKKKEEWNSINKKVEIGDLVEVLSGPFQKCKGSVHSINGNKVTIKVNLFDRSLDYTLSSEDLEIIDR